jgi:hypothetical protein
MRHYNIDHISITPSPLDTRTRCFQPGTLFDSNTFESIRSSVYSQPKNITSKEKKEEEQERNQEEGEYEARGEEIQRLSQSIICELPADHNEIADALIELLDLIDNTTSNIVNDSGTDREEASNAVNSTRPYPPINQTGVVEDHDRPYADYGHLGMFLTVILNFIQKQDRKKEFLSKYL